MFLLHFAMIPYIKEFSRLLFCLTKKYYFMETLIKFLMWGLAGFLLAAFSTLFGAVLGWFVGLFFGKAILGVLACIGIKGFSMWQIGATLGFIGGFFCRKINIQDMRNAAGK